MTPIRTLKYDLLYYIIKILFEGTVIWSDSPFLDVHYLKLIFFYCGFSTKGIMQFQA